MALYSLVTPNELSVFCKEMSVIFFSQVTLLEGTQLLAEQSANKHVKAALTDMHDKMSQGYTFSQTMAEHSNVFTPYLCSMTAIGETSGTLDDIFNRMSDYFEKDAKTRKKLRSAAAYPTVLTVLMLGVVVLLITRILPMFEDLLYSMGGEMPGVTASLLKFGNFVTHNVFIILAVIIVLIIGAIVYIRSKRGAFYWDKFLVKLPLLRFLNNRLFTARFARSMAILLKSGIQILNALTDILPTIDNQYLKNIYESKIDEVREGKTLTEAFAGTGLFPPLFMRLLTVGQNTGHLDEMLDKAANVFDEEVSDALDKVTSAIEPALIIILTVIVGIILLSVMLPMIGIMNAIG